MSFLRILAFIAPVASQVVNHANWHEQYPTQYKPSEFEEIWTVSNAENPNNVFAFFAPQSAPSGPSVPIFELVRAFDHRNMSTKFHKNRKKTVDAILPTDRQTGRQTDRRTMASV